MAIKKTTYQKGKEFESQFADFMLKDLGYDKVRDRAFLTSRINPRGSEVDIVGVIEDRRGHLFLSLSLIMLGISFLFLLYSLLFEDYEMIYISIPLIIGGLIYPLIARNMFNKYTWVECKAWSKNVPLKEVRDCYNRFKEYNASKDKRHACHKMIFVAKSGFVPNVKDYAKDNDIELYVLGEKSFELLEYWN